MHEQAARSDIQSCDQGTAETSTTLLSADEGVPPLSPAEAQIQRVIDMLSNPMGCDIEALKSSLRVFLADPYRQIGKTLDRVHFADNAYVTEAAINLGIAFALHYANGTTQASFHPHEVLTFARKFSVDGEHAMDGKQILTIVER